VFATLPSPLSPIVLDGGFMLRFTISKVIPAIAAHHSNHDYFYLI
jgi:hypothetical protein